MKNLILISSIFIFQSEYNHYKVRFLNTNNGIILELYKNGELETTKNLLSFSPTQETALEILNEII